MSRFGHGKSISVIIPVYQEEKTISVVIQTLLKCKFIDEIICVNDGSKDNSLSIIKGFEKEIKIMDFKRNHGKGFALASGIKQAKGELVVFLDADLINLSVTHVETLVKPILLGSKRATLGYLTENKRYDLTRILKKITGQRVYYKADLSKHLDQISKSRFGVEIYLNHVIPKEITALVPLLGLRHTFKHHKSSYKWAISQTIREVFDVTYMFSKHEAIYAIDYNFYNIKRVKNNLLRVKGGIDKVLNYYIDI